MTKIMLVEDDKSLREIYGVRLLAEGYDIVSAGDGEEALAMAIKERPQLIVSDVMMPKISGFDMLDILRSTTETRNIKVIMMTALSSEEQRQRGEQLGADRYLVKSQVGIEDVVRVVHEVLEDLPSASPSPTPAAPQPNPTMAASMPQSTPAYAGHANASAQTTAPVATPAASQPAPTTAPAVSAQRTPAADHTNPVAASSRSRIIQPLNDPHSSSVDINELLDKELAKEAGVDADARPAVASTDAERQLMSSQISQFEEQLPTESAGDADDSIPNVNISPEGKFTPAQSNDPDASSVPATSSPPAIAPSATMPTPISFTNAMTTSPPAPLSAPVGHAQATRAMPTFVPPRGEPSATPPPPPPPPVPPMPTGQPSYGTQQTNPAAQPAPSTSVAPMTPGDSPGQQ